jgi:hypothetical protein
MDTVVQGYQPLDLQQIQKAIPKNFKKIQSDKDLEGEVVELGQILKDLGKCATVCSIHLTFFFKNSCRLEKEVGGVSKNSGNRIPLRWRLLGIDKQNKCQFLHSASEQAGKCAQYIGKCTFILAKIAFDAWKSCGMRNEDLLLKRSFHNRATNGTQVRMARSNLDVSISLM